MKRLCVLLLGVCLPAFAQVNVQGSNIQIGGNSGSGGATLPTNAVVFGVTPTASRAANSGDLQTILQGATGCTTAGYVYSPQSGTCVPAGSISLPHTFNIMRGDNAGNLTNSPFSPANCTGNGVIFTGHGCANMTVLDDGSAPSPTATSLTGWLTTHYAYGPVQSNAGAAEGRSTQIRGDYGVLATAGIRNIDQSSTSAYGVGDVLFYNWVHNCHSGTAFPSDQGCQLIYNWGGQGNSGGHYNSTVPSGQGGSGATTLSLNQGFGCNDPLNQNCVPSPGTQMLDGSAIANGKFTAPSATSSHVSWLQEIATDQTTLPTSTKWGYNASVSVTGGSWDSPATSTVTLTNQTGGAFAAGDLVCVMGDQFEEQSVITSVSGPTPGQSITLPLGRPETKIALFKGGCQFIQLGANAALHDYSVYPAVSIDGAHWIYGLPGYGVFGSAFLPTGVVPETYDGTANAAFSAFCGARVTKLDWVQNPFNTHLEPNGCPWNVGDAIQTPDFNAQKVNGFINNAQQFAPSSSNAKLQGIINSIDGMGASGNAVGIENTNFFSQDCSAYNVGTCGGKLAPPIGHLENGVWNQYFNAQYSPASTAFYINGHLPGQNSYTVWRDASWGTLSINSTDALSGTPTWYFNNSAVRIPQGGLWAQSLISAGLGFQGGVGNGGGDYAGIEMQMPTNTSTWLTPCSEYPFGGGNSTDLCVTSQGASRTSYIATADRALQADHVTLTGASTPGAAGFAKFGAGTLQTPAASYAFFSADSSGNGELSENGGVFSRICTAGNSSGVTGCGGGGGGAIFPSTNGVVFNTSTTASRVATGDTDYQSILSTPSASSLSALVVQANNVFDQNCNNPFTPGGTADGSHYCAAGPSYASLGEFIDDQSLACRKNPAKCSAALLSDTLTKWDAAFNVNKGYPVVVPQDPTTITNGAYCSAWDQNCQVGYTTGVATGDGRIQVPQVLYEYCQKVGFGSSACGTKYTALVPHIKAVWALVPRDATTHLYQVVPGAEYVCGLAFQEYMRLTGFVAGCNVEAAIDDADMLAIATAQNDSTNVTFFTNDLAQLVAGIRGNLIDGTSGLLLAATIQNNANLDVVNSALAVACDLMPQSFAPCGILTSAQKTAIENYFNTNYSTLVNSNGYVLETPRAGGWATVGYIPAGGGPPYGASSFNGTQYQGGYWSFHNDWFAAALGVVNQAQVATLLQTFLNGTDPGTEWYNQGSTTPQGTTPNLESPQWAVTTNVMYPLAPAYTAGAGCINKYGALTTSTSCATGGTGLIYGTNNITTANTPVIFDGSTTNNQLFKMTSANTQNTAMLLGNTSTGGKLWGHGVIGSSGGSFAGNYFFLDSTDGTNPLGIQSNGFGAATNGIIGFYSGGTASTPIDTAISRDAAGTFDFGNGTAGDKSGVLKATSMTLTGSFLAAATSGQFATFGSGGYTVGASGAGSLGDVILNNGTGDTPGVLFYHGNNSNIGIDDAASGTWNTCTGNFLRIVKNLDEAGGAIMGCFDQTGNMSAGGSGYFGNTLQVAQSASSSSDIFDVTSFGAATGNILKINPVAGASTLYGAGICYGGSAYCTNTYDASSGSAITTSPHITYHSTGDSVFASGTLTITFSVGPSFASATTYSCTANDVTAANPIQVVYNSGTSVTFNGTGTDHFRYACVGE